MLQQRFLLCLLAMLGTGAACAQNTSTRNEAPAIASAGVPPVAYVYVSSSPSGASKNVVYAFAASANGKLTPVPGSPFADNLTSMAVNGKYLFGSTRNGTSVSAFLMQQNGALKSATSTNVTQFNPSGCGGNSPIVLDHTGASLYAMGESSGLCDEEFFESFQVNQSTGSLSFLGNTPPIFVNYGPLTFKANNVHAYQATCSDYQSFYAGVITGYQRHSNGLLTLANISAPVPNAKTGDFYCADQAAADPTNHVAIAYQLINTSTELPDGPPQLATYTSDNSGNLSTTSTRFNMPKAAIQYIFTMRMSPSGKLLAVGGAGASAGGGVQVFHYNGASQISHYTGLLTTVRIDQIYWDKSNHLYAISQAARKLFVFTVTPTSVSQAPGSPYTIVNPKNIIVQPKVP
jgi:hypothetical protein